MAILGYNDVLQLPFGSLRTWNQIEATVSGSSGGQAVTGLPVTNIVDPSLGKVWRRNVTSLTPGGLTATIIARIETIPGWLRPSGYNINNIGLIGVLGLRTIVGSTDAGAEYDLQVRIKGSATAFGGTDAFDQTRTFYANEFPGAWPRQVWFDNVPSATDPTAGGGVGAKAGRVPARYWQIEITVLQTPLSPYDLDVARVVFMNAFVAPYEPTPELAFEDASEVVRSQGGQPYALRKSAARSVRGQFLRLTDREVFGYSELEAGSSLSWGSTITAINKLSGNRGEVVLLPDLYSKATGTGGRLPSAWQTQPVFGRLDRGITARRVATTGGTPAPGQSTGALWTADLSITETPLG